jgi:hypothetical protein
MSTTPESCSTSIPPRTSIARASNGRRKFEEKLRYLA